MKKIFIMSVLGFSVLSLFACSDTEQSTISSTPEVSEEPKVLTNYEKTQKFFEEFSIPNSTQIIKNIALPKKYEVDGVIAWKSSNPKVVSPEGFVTRSATSSQTAVLTCEASLGGTIERRVYEVVVKQIPVSSTDKVDEAISDFYLLENNSIDRDTMILPRITDINGVYITWQSSDTSIIDLNGNVFRTSTVQTCTMTGTFTLGDVSKTKDFVITVGSTADDDPISINTLDPRIKNKIFVANELEFIAKTKSLNPGDAIILKDGDYRDLPITIHASGTKENPIFLFAENPGKVNVKGESRIEVNGDYVTIANLNFIDGFPKTDTGVVALNGNYLRFTNNRIYQYEQSGYDYKWLSLTGRFHEIDRNVFDGKSTGGSLLTVWRNDLTSQNHHIHKNEFKNFKESGGANGYETMRIGTSTYSQTDSNVLIEDNLFDNVSGEIEIISIKAGRTIVKNNTFSNCVGLVTCRHGKNSLIEDNVFMAGKIQDTGGIRMYDGGHIIRNNYIQEVNTSSNTRGGIVIHTGVNEAATTTTMNLQWIPFNVLVENNTIVDSRNSILVGGKYTYACKDVVLKGNLVVSPTYGAVRYDKLPDNMIYQDNYFYAPTLIDSSGAIKEFTCPTGINFSTEIPVLNVNSAGLKLHQTFGAQNLMVNTSSTVGIDW